MLTGPLLTMKSLACQVRTTLESRGLAGLLVSVSELTP